MTPEDSTSAEDVLEPQYDLILPVEEPSSSSVKCNICDAKTEHLWWKFIPQGLENQMDPMQQLAGSKRLVFCTHCAAMRLIN